jgi:hypothetical protein
MTATVARYQWLADDAPVAPAAGAAPGAATPPCGPPA